MANIHIERTHHLGLEEARQHVEQFAEQLKEELSVEYHWKGNDLLFKRSGANGTVQLSPGCITCDVKLSMLLTPMKGKIEDAINDKLNRSLG